MHRREFLKSAVAFSAAAAWKNAPAQTVRPATGPLRVHPQNPRYFADASGRPVFLTGAHTWANLQDTGVAPVPTFDWQGYLGMMLSHNHNFMRLWGWQQSAWAPWTPDKILFEPVLYMRTGPGTALDGGPKFDLKKFNPAYFDRMFARLTECRDRGIYCAVQLFQGFSSNKGYHCGSLTWSGHPYNAQNNINGIDGDKDGDKVVDWDQPAVRELHAAYLQKVVDTVASLDNVLYEVINEAGVKDWDWWVVDTVHKMETEKGKRHPVGLTGAGSERMEEMMASPADWISPFGRKFLFDPPAWDGKKVSVNDTDHLWGHGGTVSWAWKSFVRGHNTLLMDSWDPIAGSPCPEVNWGPRPGYPLRDLNRRDDWTWEPVRKAIGYTRAYSLRMDLASAAPHDELASTGYCLANPEREFLVYLPEGDQVSVDLSRAQGRFSVEWMLPAEGTITLGGSITGGKQQSFAVPFTGPSVLYIKKESA
ncbi:MAG: DUF6298 domain-containing protein [Acidobacteriia bacterium]|nr:DUF6298 domain-containing protein [Terriglobia bacterium]